MKLEVRRHCLVIIPETEIDEAYLEEVLGLRTEQDCVRLRRHNASGLSCWAYAKAEREGIKVHGA